MFPGMETWDIASLDVEPHQPEVLRSDAEARVIAINLPAGEQLQEHQVHERAGWRGAAGGVGVEQDGPPAAAGSGSAPHFEPKQRHPVPAKPDTRLLLFLAPWPGEGHP